LLIKDHKKPKSDGNYPTRLIIPATNFTACFPKLGYLGIKKIFDRCSVNYTRNTIIQASDLKDKLEKLNVRRDEVTIVSIDAQAMYPSIKFKLVINAVNFFAKNLSTIDRETIDDCLKLIQFGMGNTLLTFVDKYYEYGGECEIDDRGLTIGGYESAWLADLVAAFILENSDEHFKDTMFKGIYRDDGIGIFKGNWMEKDIVNWLGIFNQPLTG
jgi:hypothetical protein